MIGLFFRTRSRSSSAARTLIATSQKGMTSSASPEASAAILS
ncbi:hypothetical protein QW131_12590 [Roseibium salinum]|nr:hypothetical protein [Roseibium salinum]